MHVTTLPNGHEQIATDSCIITVSEHGAFCTDCGATNPARHGPLLRRWIDAHIGHHDNVKNWSDWSSEIARVVARVAEEAAEASKQGTLYADGRRDALLWVADVLADVQVHAMGEPEY